MTRQAYDLNTEGFGPGTNGPLVLAAELPNAAAKPKVDALAERVCAATRRWRSSPTPRAQQAGDAAIDHRDPEGLASGQADRGPRQPPAWRRRSRRARAAPASTSRSAA